MEKIVRVLCDTNILIEYYKNNPVILQELKNIGAINISISVITKAELFYGARNKQELTKIERHLSFCQCYEINTETSLLFSSLMKAYALSHQVSIPDMLIAATAINHGLPLYTLNVKDFCFIPDINLYPYRSLK
jgi:predicted nucleic acid-binding protein